MIAVFYLVFSYYYSSKFFLSRLIEHSNSGWFFLWKWYTFIFTYYFNRLLYYLKTRFFQEKPKFLLLIRLFLKDVYFSKRSLNFSCISSNIFFLMKGFYDYTLINRIYLWNTSICRTQNVIDVSIRVRVLLQINILFFFLPFPCQNSSLHQ